MPMISQLPTAVEIAASDAVPLSQSGVARSVSVGNLLAGTQPAIMASSGSLLGRRSLGSGGPEEIAVGNGLLLNDGTLAAVADQFQALETLEAVASDVVLVAVADGQLKAVPQQSFQCGYTAGDHIDIDPSGVISAIWPEAAQDTGSPLWDISTTPTLTTVTADDLVPIVRGGSPGVVSFGNLLNGRTIDQLQPSGVLADSDHIMVAQGNNVMSRQSLAALWLWLSAKVESLRFSVVELTHDTTLDATVHNGRVLVCSTPVTLTPILLNLGNGFHCEVINLSSGDLVLAAPIMTASGTNTVPSGGSALIRCISTSTGMVAYASGFGLSGGGAVPGVVSNLAATDVTASSVSVSWDAPVTGGAVSGYTVYTRQTGTSDWTIRGDGLAQRSFTIVGLVAGLSHDVTVAANSTAGRGMLSSVLSVAVPAGQLAPGMVTGLTVVPQSSSSMSVSWVAPTSGGAPTTYTLQYRVSGSTTWSHTMPNLVTLALVVNALSPATAYEFRVYAMNDGGAGPPTSGLVATTFPQGGAVSTIVWNLVPVGPYGHGQGSIGVNARVQPADEPVRFGFSTSALAGPTAWTAGVHVNTDFWAAYVPAPASAGTWYAWVEGLDGSCPVVHPTPFHVT